MKKSFSKIISVVLSAILTLGLIPLTAASAEESDSGKPAILSIETNNGMDWVAVSGSIVIVFDRAMDMGNNAHTTLLPGIEEGALTEEKLINIFGKVSTDEYISGKLNIYYDRNTIISFYVNEANQYEQNITISIDW